MRNRENWNHIANSFYAVDKIRNIKNRSALREEQNYSVRESNFFTLMEILKVVSEYSSGTYKNTLSEAVNKSSLYGNTYRNLKNHVSTVRGHSPNMEDLTKTLSIIRPVVGNNHRTLIDKILQIYKIIID